VPGSIFQTATPGQNHLKSPRRSACCAMSHWTGKPRESITRTGEDNEHSDGDADRVVLIADDKRNGGWGKEKEDEGVLVNLLGELEQDVLLGGDLELVRAVDGAEVGEEGWW
jgi:hypothetical protein